MNTLLRLYIFYPVSFILSISFNNTKEFTPLIFKGSQVSISDYSYACFLHFKNTRPTSCGASLILVQAIVTAAHCMDDLRYKNGEVYAYFGSNIPDESSVLRKVVNYEINPKYNEENGKNNIAVAFLNFKVPLHSLIAKIPLAMKDSATGTRLYSVGWGKQHPPQLGELGDFSVRRPLKITVQRMIQLHECNEVTGYNAASGMLCTVPILGIHAEDDAGDGLVSNNPRVLVGVLSYVSESYSVYTGVAVKWDWIVKTCKVLFRKTCPQKKISE